MFFFSKNNISISYIYPLTEEGTKYIQDNFNTELDYKDFQDNDDMFGTL